MTLLLQEGAAPGQPRQWLLSSILFLAITLLLQCPQLTASFRTDPTGASTSWDPTAGTVLSNITKDVVLQFIPANKSHILTHIATDNANSDVYLGAVNRLYQLDGRTMKPIHQVVTGPRLDSDRCPATGCDSDVEKSLTDNYNKLLVVAPSTESIIACGSVSQGACDTYRRGNLSVHNHYIPKSVAANDPYSSTFAFIGPERYSTFGESEALYIGTTFTSRGNYRHDVPALATRNLVDLNFSKYTFSEQSLLGIDVKHRDHFLVKYVYGFNASNYVYFLAVQKKSHHPGQEEAGYISRISRICISDDNYNSYTEISLECHVSHDPGYNLVQDAAIFEAGHDLAASIGILAGDQVMIAAFSKSQGHTDKPQKSTAICLYSVKDIDARFDENIHMCFNGSSRYRNMEYISGTISDGKCPRKWSTGNIRNFCDVGLKISGSAPLVSRSVLRLNSSLVTSVVATAAGSSHTVAFLGTSVGTIKKILLTSSEEAAEYSELDVDPDHAILQGMRFTRNKQYIYVLSKFKASKVAVQSCSYYADCSSCLLARDPYCGWCSLEKRCTVASACENAGFSSPRWLNVRSGQQCIDFEAIDPDGLPFSTEASRIQLTIRTLPALPSGAKYQCVWGTSPPTDAQVTSTGLTCPAPPLRQRPSIPRLTDHTLVPLSVRSSETNKDFVSRNFAFYDCSRHTTCGSCVRSNWACNWCVYQNSCTHNSSTCRKTVVSGEQNPVKLPVHGINACPRFLPRNNDLLASDGSRTELFLAVRNLPTPTAGQLGFQCVVSIEGATMLVTAIESADNDDIIICEPAVYHYEAEVPEYNASLTLVWNRNHEVGTRILTLYKCGVLGAHRGQADCSLCVTRHRRYRCSWCLGSCNFAGLCPASARPLLSPHHQDLPSPPTGTCPNPRIDMIHPLSGPLEGGTLVTIEGSNLGLRKEDVLKNVYIGDVLCSVEEYHVSVKILCRTGEVPPRFRMGELEFSVRVTTPAGTTMSTVMFSYKNVTIDNIWPPQGPMSGGTVISIGGHYLNIGTNITAMLDGLPCKVNKTQSSSQRLVCTTSRNGAFSLDTTKPQTQRMIRTLTVTIDNAVRMMRRPFTYTPDPSVQELKPLRSPWSGGRIITVHGSYLDAVQTPQITVLFHERVLNSSTCKVVSPSLMECPSPPVDRNVIIALLRDRRSSEAEVVSDSYSQLDVDIISRNLRSPRQNIGNSLALDVGFIMDNVASVRNLRHVMPSSLRMALVYVLDPLYRKFPNSIKLYKGDTLVIEGENLNLASDETDVNVTIGSRQCNVTSLALSQLVCNPPESQPSPTDETGRPTQSGLPLVVVRVGSNLRYDIGLLRYEMMKEYQFPPEAIGGMAAGGLFLALMSMVILVVYRRKSNQAEREYKRIQIQMDTLESNVRSECKQAFAELQTDMTDLTADLQSSGIPNLDLRTYIMKVFFPGVSDHPILNDPKYQMSTCRTAGESNAMVQFEQLISNRYFLLAFIETLEAQKTFNIRDKVNVASLLVVVLTGRMEYLTEVLRMLLLRLIDKSIATKHPQLMLRRTETVVEKMLTNWLALCMYCYLKEEAGPAIFLLYKAIKHQVEKGPVDAVTHDARYCLSEERLLREQVTHSPVTLHLIRDEPHYEKIPYSTPQYVAVLGEDGEKAQCRVLDCDTISQVKSKILDALYRSTPYSMRPSVHDLDLEWRHGRNGHVVLADEDITTRVEPGNWRRLNTLAHYGVADSAIMALVPRPQCLQAPPPPSHHNHHHHQSHSALHQPRSLHATLNHSLSAKFNTCNTYSRSTAGSPVSPNLDFDNPGAPRNYYHLVKPIDHDSPLRASERTHKAIPEIFLTRLLSTKGTIQKFVDDCFRTILSHNSGLPPAIKWLFDLFDDAAKARGITDPEVVTSWKSNSLPLRFWVNFIKNPDFILDVHKSPTVDSCLSVIAQTFMDSCSTSEHRLGKDSPSNKLLFAKDMPHYRAQVRGFYQGIRDMQVVTDHDMASHLHQLSLSHLGHIDTVPALQELFHTYVLSYYPQILDTLAMDPECRSLHLAHKLDIVLCSLQEEPTSMC
uniref:Plexin-B-like n=5 Tax=Hirondellea gigas TaxID=1518452 RepID=A0A6A7FXH8_9CRUS